MQTRAGHHYLTGGFYTDASFSTLLNPAATVNTPDDLFMSVSMSSWDSSLNIILEQCWATPNRNWLNISDEGKNKDFQATKFESLLKYGLLFQPKKVILTILKNIHLLITFVLIHMNSMFSSPLIYSLMEGKRRPRLV